MTSSAKGNPTKSSPAKGAEPKGGCCTLKKGLAIGFGACGGCLLIFILIIVIVFLASWGRTFSSDKFSNIVIEDGDSKINAYVAKPKEFETQQIEVTKYPTAIVFHAWNGLSEEVTYFADRLAEQGMYAIAPDLFRGVSSESTNILWNIINVISNRQAQMDKTIDATLKYLLTLEPVNNNIIDKTKIVSGPGFCFGGTQSLVLSSRWRTAGTITLYGTFIRELSDANSEAWGRIGHPGEDSEFKSPLLGIYGDLDRAPGPKDVEKFEQALNTKGIDNTIKMFNGVGHAFVNEKTHADIDSSGHKQAREAWDEVITFFKTNNGISDLAELDPTSASAVSPAPPKSRHVRRNSAVEFDEQTVSITDSAQASREISQGNHRVSESVSLWHRIQCAFKCAWDVLTGAGHV